jgi:hypothetical protein
LPEGHCRAKVACLVTTKGDELPRVRPREFAKVLIKTTYPDKMNTCSNPSLLSCDAGVDITTLSTQIRETFPWWTEQRPLVTLTGRDSHYHWNNDLIWTETYITGTCTRHINEGSSLIDYSSYVENSMNEGECDFTSRRIQASQSKLHYPTAERMHYAEPAELRHPEGTDNTSRRQTQHW